VNDRTVWIVLLGGALFLAVGAVSLRTALRSIRAGRSEAGERRVTWRTLAFFFPVLLGLLVPARPLSASSGQASSLGSLQLASHVSSGGSGDSFGAWIGDLASHPNADWWAGQHVTLVGFAAGEPGLPRRSFIVGRYLITCCVVDATLLGFPVQLVHGTLPPQGAWVQVSGVFGRQYWTDPGGSRYPLVQHARLFPVSIPSDPYLSP
jgi:uncharacterized repeat protein (TIGR03943 family)